MKHNYLSPWDFQKNCPCSYFLTSYAESLYPNTARISFVKGHQLMDDENTYIAEFDITLKGSLDTFPLVVSCTILPDGMYQYDVIHRTDAL